jgi:phosphoribosylamine--glycine ligase
MNVLIIGSGGREHALCWKIFQSLNVEKIFCAPGNGGTAQIATNVDIKANDIIGLRDFAVKNKIKLTIVGPEDPLVLGIVDEFEKVGLKIIGPDKAAAILEGSKVFMKRLLAANKIPTAPFIVLNSTEKVAEYLADHSNDSERFPLVIKLDGLAAGKGVGVCKNMKDAEIFLKEIDEGKFGKYSGKIIVEDFLDGQELSYIVLVDKNGNVLPLATSQDHKRRDDNDRGPNTGGMGAYSPAPLATKIMEQRILKEIIYPTLKAMKEAGKSFAGFLYAGLMIVEGNPFVLEFNVRLGDPETQPILVRMKNDLVSILESASKGELDKRKIYWDPRPAVCVVMAAKGYPDGYEKGYVISELDQAEKNGAIVFHAGTKMGEDLLFRNVGGRVLGVTARGKIFQEAIKNAYSAVAKIHCDNLFCRSDIGKRALEKELKK